MSNFFRDKLLSVRVSSKLLDTAMNMYTASERYVCRFRKVSFGGLFDKLLEEYVKNNGDFPAVKK